MTRLRQAAKNEEGVAMLISLIILFVLLGLGAGLMMTAGAQQRAAANGQNSETAYSLAEAALNAQVFALSQGWPTKAGGTSTTAPDYGYPLSCNAASNGASYCPTASDLSTYSASGNCPSNTQGDAWNSSSTVSNGWTTYVRDAGTSTSSSASLFSSSAEQTALPFDASGGGALWIRAVGIVNCKVAVVVTKVSEQIEKVSFPDYVVNANSFSTGNNGNQTILNTTDTSGNSSPISLRCVGSTYGSGAQPPSSTCAGVGNPNQVQPSVSYANPPSASPTLDSSQLKELELLAHQNGQDYPANNCSWFNNPVASTVVYINGPCSSSSLTAANVGYDSATGTCSSYTFLVVANGPVSMGGNTDFCGVIYAPNLSGMTGNVVTLSGDATIIGGLNVDGNAALNLGDSGNGTTCTDTNRNQKCGDLEFNLGAFLNIDGFAGVDPTPNSFRQLPSTQ
jgi:Tfp pilus assembly protein PilX